MNTPQFHIAEFERLLKRAVSGRDSFYHCSAETVATIKDILHTDYPEREDDIEFLMDMVNYRMRQSDYKGPSPGSLSAGIWISCVRSRYISVHIKKGKVYPESDKPFLFSLILLSYALMPNMHNVLYLTIHFVLFHLLVSYIISYEFY